jgi:hypothetical protein
MKAANPPGVTDLAVFTVLADLAVFTMDVSIRKERLSLLGRKPANFSFSQFRP